MKFKEENFRSDNDRLFELSDVLSASKLNHTPFIIFNGDKVELVRNGYDLLEYPPDTEVMVQWRGEWRSDFFHFTCRQLHIWLLINPEKRPILTELVKSQRWLTVVVERENEAKRIQEVNDNLARRKLEPCVHCGILRQNWRKADGSYMETECPSSIFLGYYNRKPAHQSADEVEDNMISTAKVLRKIEIEATEKRRALKRKIKAKALKSAS